MVYCRMTPFGKSGSLHAMCTDVGDSAVSVGAARPSGAVGKEMKRYNAMRYIFDIMYMYKYI